MTSIKKWFNNLALYKKILLIVSACTFILYCSFVLCISFLSEKYEKNIYEANASLLKHVTTTLADDISEIENISNSILVDSSIQENLTLLDPSNPTLSADIQKKIYDTLINYTFSNPYIQSITISVPEYGNISVGDNNEFTQYDMKQVREETVLLPGTASWSHPVDAGNQLLCSRLIRQIKYLSLRELGTVYIIINAKQMINDALYDAGYSAYDSQFLLIDAQQLIYPAENYSNQKVMDIYQQFETDSLGKESDTANHYTITSINDQKKFIIYGCLENLPWNYLYIRDYNALFQQLQTIKSNTIIISFLCFGIMLAAIYLFVNRILWHITILIRKIEKFGRGEPLHDQDLYDSYENRNDEIGHLHQSFDQMTKSVKLLRDENYDKQILLKDTTIKMLQQQINPHFLYNTLDTINWLAQKYGADDISTIAASLGMLFRSSISGQDIIPLEEELNILNNYISIQQIRFRDRFVFSLSVPNDLSGIYVPKLCIQPLVENAIKYSVEYSDDTCTIFVIIQEHSSFYSIEVSNTGSRFEDDLLEKLKNHEIIPHGSGIGLTNIDSRLRLLYGSNYSLRIFNKEERATVILSIPKNGEH